jgi:hypothetical protein
MEVYKRTQQDGEPGSQSPRRRAPRAAGFAEARKDAFHVDHRPAIYRGVRDGAKNVPTRTDAGRRMNFDSRAVEPHRASAGRRKIAS